MSAPLSHPQNFINTDIDGLVRRINRFIFEICRSQSSNVSQNIPFDTVRNKSYVTALRAYLTYFTAEPLLDLPKTAPREIQLPEPAPVQSIENDSAKDFAVLMELLRDEMAFSDSGRIPTNLIPHDKRRALALLDRMDSFVDGYMSKIDPLDVPESTPSYEMSGSGKGQ